jgi:hypothetical protein
MPECGQGSLRIFRSSSHTEHHCNFLGFIQRHGHLAGTHTQNTNVGPQVDVDVDMKKQNECEHLARRWVFSKRDEESIRV